MEPVHARTNRAQPLRAPVTRKYLHHSIYDVLTLRLGHVTRTVRCACVDRHSTSTIASLVEFDKTRWFALTAMCVLLWWVLRRQPDPACPLLPLPAAACVHCSLSTSSRLSRCVTLALMLTSCAMCPMHAPTGGVMLRTISWTCDLPHRCDLSTPSCCQLLVMPCSLRCGCVGSGSVLACMMHRLWRCSV
jgi:hypothetical protein